MAKPKDRLLADLSRDEAREMATKARERIRANASESDAIFARAVRLGMRQAGAYAHARRCQLVFSPEMCKADREAFTEGYLAAEASELAMEEAAETVEDRPVRPGVLRRVFRRIWRTFS